MSLIYEIMIGVGGFIRPISAGHTSTLLAPPEAVDPVNRRNGDHDRDEMDFDKKIIQKHKELNFKNEPGSYNPHGRKVSHDPYNLS